MFSTCTFTVKILRYVFPTLQTIESTCYIELPSIRTISKPATMSASTPTRRNGITSKTTASNPMEMRSPPSPSTRTVYNTSPFLTLLPTSHESALLSLYPLLLTLGSLYSLLSPTTRSTTYSPLTQSYPQTASASPSYFARKDNILNRYFVKVAWFWVSVSYAAFLFLHSSTGPPRNLVLTPKRLRGILRWMLVTGWWILVTQWCFGPALIDRGFAVTGGACALAEAFEHEGGGEAGGKMEVWTGRACKAIGGQWRGGHDISGHVFILVLGSAVLALEVLPAFVKGRERRQIARWDGGVGRVERSDGDVDEDGEEGDRGGGVTAPMVVIGLSWWMLLMTAAFFHTWFEKLTGLLTALLGVLVVYLLPRAIPAIRDAIGMPGI